MSAILLSAVMTVSAMPAGFASAEDDYQVRDPFYNYNSGYNYYESEHFQFIWGNSSDASKVTSEFLEGNAKNLEDCWDVYMNELEMAAPSQSTNLDLRDGKEYKTNIYISGTGLSGMEDDWAYMSYDSEGYAYMFCCVDSMQYNPPSWVLPHEFGHVVTAHQLGWNNNKYSYAWWEAMGNWYREQYLYSDYSTDETGHGTDFFETYMKNLSFTFPCGRDYYAAWPFLQYLTENPDNMDGYGSSFVKKMLQEGQVDEYPFDIVDRLAPADLKDTLGNFAKHMAGLDFKEGNAYRARLNELLTSGSWNWQQIYTMLEPVAGAENTYRVPTERAPQYAGMNIVPLDVSGEKISVSLNAMYKTTDDNWRACIVQQMADGSCVYSDLFGNAETMTVSKASDVSAAYLTVIATPDIDSITKAGLPYGPDSEFSENNVPFSSKQQYPYTVTINGAEIKKREVTTGNNWWESYHNHSNGGGLVSDSANVDDSVYVAPYAKILGSASVTGNVHIEDHAVVQDNASVSGNAVISGYAIIAENASVSDNAIVSDCASVMGQANISGNARVIESAWIFGTYTMKDDSCAKGQAFCMANGSLSGQAVVDGDYYDDGGKTSSKGTAFGWVSSQSYVDALPSMDKLMYSYDFSKNVSGNIADKYNSTYIDTNAEWSEKMTGADNVLSFNENQYADLDRGILYTDDIDIQLAVLPKSSGTILYLGNDNSFIKLSLNSNGCFEAIFKNEEKTEKLTAPSQAVLGEWTKIRIILDENTGRLIINDETAASDAVTINPNDIAKNVEIFDKTAAYRIGSDNNMQNGFTGRVDCIRIYLSEAEASPEMYTESEEISNTPVRGDVNADGIFSIADAVMLQKWLVCAGSITDMNAGDLCSDGRINICDLCSMKLELMNK